MIKEFFTGRINTLGNIAGGFFYFNNKSFMNFARFVQNNNFGLFIKIPV